MSSIQTENIPDALTALPSWVVWKYEMRDGESKPTKVLYNPRTAAPHGTEARRAQTDNPGTWGTFAYALECLGAPGATWEGVGVVISKADGITGVDLDDSWDDDDTLTDDAGEIVAALNSYTEVTPSTKGVRVFVFGNLPPGDRRRRGSIEMYDDRRFFAVTGNRLNGSSKSVEAKQDELTDMWRKFVAEPEADKKAKPAPVPSDPSHGFPVTPPLDMSDEELLTRAMTANGNGAKFSALWRGDLSGHGDDQSAADLALCNTLAFWCGGPDAARVDALFRRSGLMRPKWDEKRGAFTYGEKTVTKAIMDCTGFYTPPGVEANWAGTTNATSDPAGDDGDTDDGPTLGDLADGPSAPRPQTPKATNKPRNSKTPASAFPNTEYGNAERITAWHGADLRYCSALGWLVWDGKRWIEDLQAGRESERRAKASARRIHTDAESALKLIMVAKTLDGADEKILDEKEKSAKSLIGWGRASESRANLSASLALTMSEPGVPVAVDALDPDPFAFCAANGIVNLRTGTLSPHRRDALITRASPAVFDPAATAPLWEVALTRWQPDAEVRAFLQRAAGYTLTGDVGEETLFFLYGDGRNGKSKFIEALEFVMGHYSARVPIQVIMDERKANGPTPDIVPLAGARLVIASEISKGKTLNEGFIKDITGGDQITARQLRQESFTFKPRFKMWLYGNHKPRIIGADDGIWARLPLIPFDVFIPPAERDPALSYKLRQEASGILNWAVAGCLAWQREGLNPPKHVIEASEEYRREEDPLLDFFEACCVFDKNAVATLEEIKSAFRRWSSLGTDARIPYDRDFTERLKRKGAETKLKRTDGKQKRVWLGVGIKPEAEADAPNTGFFGKEGEVSG